MKIKYKTLYAVSEREKINDNEMDNFYLCGDINWDYYFDKEVRNSEKIESVQVLEFDSELELIKELKKIKRINLLDYCIDEWELIILKV